MVVFFSILTALVGGTYLFMQQAVFGKEPTGQRLARIEASPNYKDGAFQNQLHTPMSPPDVSYWQMAKHLILKPKDVKPPKSLPFVKIGRAHV